MSSDPFEDHDLRDVWNYVKSHGDNYHTARMVRDEERRDALDVYPHDDVTDEEAVEFVKSEFDVEVIETEFKNDSIRFIKK